MIEWLQDWYEKQCDGDWEHGYGIRIETIDNPGWSVEIDLNDTEFSISDFQYELFEKSESDWVGFEVNENVFTGVGDPLKLNIIISVFKEVILKKRLDTELLLQCLNRI